MFAKVWEACSGGGHAGRTVTVKLKYADFQQATRSQSHAGPIATRPTLERISLDLLRPLFPPPLGVRLGSVKNLGRYAASWIAGCPNRPSSTAALT